MSHTFINLVSSQGYKVSVYVHIILHSTPCHESGYRENKKIAIYNFFIHVWIRTHSAAGMVGLDIAFLATPLILLIPIIYPTIRIT